MIRSLPLSLITVLLIPMASVIAADGLSREEKVRADKAKVEADGYWIYNDLDKAYAEANRTGKPIIVALRCIPCEECVKLDDGLIDKDPVVRPLLDKFVRVRVVGTNGLDLNLFQYDTDQSFAVFFLNADKTIYGRYGTRSHRTDWLDDVSIQGMARAMEGALELHKAYPTNKAALAGKRGEKLEFTTPEQYPILRPKYTDQLNYKGDVVKSCIHCHQISEARRSYYWDRFRPIPEKLLYPYPHPKAIGLILDPKERATVKSITRNSPASQMTLKPGDKILSMNGQPLLSLADVQWVLHHTPAEGGDVSLVVDRDGNKIPMTLTLNEGWRREDDTSWRVSSWMMSRIALGGMRLEELSDSEKRRLRASGDMALRVKSAGRYGKHATARRAGMKEGDIIIAFNGQTDLPQEADVFDYVSEKMRPGQKVTVKFLRNGREMSKSFVIQN